MINTVISGGEVKDLFTSWGRGGDYSNKGYYSSKYGTYGVISRLNQVLFTFYHILRKRQVALINCILQCANEGTSFGGMLPLIFQI